MGIAVIEIPAVFSDPIVVRRVATMGEPEVRQVMLVPAYYSVQDDTDGTVLYPKKPGIYPDLNEALTWVANYTPDPPPPPPEVNP